MTQYQFTIVIEKGEDHGYVATCPALRACHSQGETVEEVTGHIKEAMTLCIEHMRDKGESFPEEVKVESIVIAV